MTKHAKKSDHLQLVDLPKTTMVEIPLPLLAAFGNIENSFFDLCFDAGSQVLTAMMEQDDGIALSHVDIGDLLARN